ncbi:MAG: FAD-dependent oxidoreductase, partial [Elainellaceae cyanobacterium]
MSQHSNHILIVGGGIVGAMLAYELSQSGRQVTLLDKQSPAQGSTGAALGVLMGAISRKTKGRAWAMRQQSLAHYDQLVDDLQQQTGRTIDYNRDGIVKLLFDGDDRDRWRALAQQRQAQGWPLDLWDKDTLHNRCPGVGLSGSRFGNVIGAVHSPRDRQVHPQ